jgi:hypothetical protein
MSKVLDALLFVIRIPISNSMKGLAKRKIPFRFIGVLNP